MQLNMGMVKEACRVLLVMGEPTTYDNIARFIGIPITYGETVD